jgi:hypothetical protein
VPARDGRLQMDKTTARFAGSSSKPSSGLEPETPSLPSSDEAGIAGTAGKPRARKARKKTEVHSRVPTRARRPGGQQSHDASARELSLLPYLFPATPDESTVPCADNVAGPDDDGFVRRLPQVGESIVDATPRGIRVRVLKGVECVDAGFHAQFELVVRAVLLDENRDGVRILRPEKRDVDARVLALGTTRRGPDGA